MPQNPLDAAWHTHTIQGKVAPGVLKRSTMQRHLFNAGFGASHMDVYSDARKSSSKQRPKRYVHLMNWIITGKFSLKNTIITKPTKESGNTTAVLMYLFLMKEFHPCRNSTVIRGSLYETYTFFKKCTAGGFIRIGSHGWLPRKAFICCRQTALCCSHGRCRTKMRAEFGQDNKSQTSIFFFGF